MLYEHISSEEGCIVRLVENPAEGITSKLFELLRKKDRRSQTEVERWGGEFIVSYSQKPQCHHRVSSPARLFEASLNVHFAPSSLPIAYGIRKT